jgi:hypothetical protein
VARGASLRCERPFIGSGREMRWSGRTFKAGGECSITPVVFKEERRCRCRLIEEKEGRGHRRCLV